MTMAERIKHEGMIEVAHKLFKRKYDVTLVAEITDLPISELEKIKKTLH